MSTGVDIAPHHYVCYGLHVASEFQLDELDPVEAPPGPADVVVRRAELPGVPDGVAVLPHGMWRLGDRCGFHVDGVGRYEIRAGREILVDPAAGVARRTIRLYLLGTALGALMAQRDHLVLHGNAVRIGDGCAVVLGHSGAGKSTLAAEFSRRGLDIFSDDVVPVTRDGLAMPGSARIKLWADALEGLGVSPDGLQRVDRAHDKFQLPIRRNPLSPLPLRWIYVLERSATPALAIEPVRGATCYALLHEHTYRNEFIHGDDAVQRHLEQCARLLPRVRMSRVNRPADTMTPVATADAIIADIGAPLSGSAPDDGANEESVPA
jgi:hypothetical protein